MLRVSQESQTEEAMQALYESKKAWMALKFFILPFSFSSTAFMWVILVFVRIYHNRHLPYICPIFRQPLPQCLFIIFLMGAFGVAVLAQKSDARSIFDLIHKEKAGSHQLFIKK